MVAFLVAFFAERRTTFFDACARVAFFAGFLVAFLVAFLVVFFAPAFFFVLFFTALLAAFLTVRLVAFFAPFFAFFFVAIWFSAEGSCAANCLKLLHNRPRHD